MSEATLEAGYILHYTPWRDTSFVVDLFTLGQGRVAVVARGARAARPGLRALYSPFRPLLLSWRGAGELGTLTGVEEAGAPIALAGEVLACAYYLNEIVLRLLGKGQPQPELFAHYALALAELERGEREREAVLRGFELRLLEATGSLPALDRCLADGSRPDPTRRYRFDVVAGHAEAVDTPVADAVAEPAALAIPKRREDADGARAETGTTEDWTVELGGRTLLDMAALDFDDATTLAEARPLARRLIAAQLGGRPLRSRALFAAFAPGRGAEEADATRRPAEPSDDER